MAELKIDFAKMAEGFTKTAKKKGMFVGWWIPVSERLPEDGTWNMFTDGKQISVERFKLDAFNHFFPAGRWFSFDEAVAWMPLPTPYEPQESDNRRCGNCKYFGELLNENDTPHSCNNNKSIFKACLETATGCEKFEPQESEGSDADSD